MVTLETADKALKDVYLGIVADQLNIGINPFLAKIKKTTSDVWGKEIVKLVPYGLNGGIGAGTESGNLPTPAANNYDRFKLELKNLYGTIEISDKAIRASQSSAGAFVNLLNAEMDGLLKASKFNLGRMLFGDGTGNLSYCVAGAMAGGTIPLQSIKLVMEGMVIDLVDGATKLPISGMQGVRIISVDRASKKIVVNSTATPTLKATDFITVQGSYNNEITGLNALFGTKDLYGLPRSGRSWLNPYSKKDATFTTSYSLQEYIDHVEETAGSQINMLLCSYDMRRKFIEVMSTERTNINYMEIEGGFKTLSYNAQPLVADRFIEDKTMYFLNTDDFKMHQLCDWRWLEGDGGKVIKQKANSATYSATLVKYAEIICDKPIGQAKMVCASLA